MFWHKHREGFLNWQWWIHFGEHHECLSWQSLFWSKHCHVRFAITDDGYDFSVAFPPVALFFSLDGFKLPAPKQKCIATWDNNREFLLTDQRESQIAVHDWSIWITPWGKLNEWASKAPWYEKGWTIHILDILLGRQKYSKTEGESFEVEIPMPEGSYRGKVTVEHCFWKRPRWVAKKRTDAWVNMAQGIPFPGKGENSWDCGEDALCGFGCSSIKPEDIIARGVQSAMESRRRYGGSVNWRPERNLEKVG